MIDIKLVRENPDLVKENIKKKFQDNKLTLVDEVLKLDEENRNNKSLGDNLRSKRNTISSEIGSLMREKKIEDANAKKVEVANINEQLKNIEEKESELTEKIKKIMMTIPNIVDSSVPVGKDDSENVEIEKFGENIVLKK